MRRILRALFDPCLDFELLGLGQTRMRVRRRHDLVLILAGNAPPDVAILRIARLDPKQSVSLGIRGLGNVEPQLSLARLFVETMAGETVFRQDGPDVAIVIQSVRSPQGAQVKREQTQGEDRKAGAHQKVQNGHNLRADAMQLAFAKRRRRTVRLAFAAGRTAVGRHDPAERDENGEGEEHVGS